MNSFQNIKVSVITPTYNDEQFISETINSVLNQTHQNLELIIIDDCSTDNTRLLISKIKDSRLRFIKNKSNFGPAYCRNLGIKESRGEYIAFLDGDDVWEPTKIENQLTFMVQNSYDFCYSNFEWINEKSEKIGVLKTGPKVVTKKMFKKSDYIGCLTAIYKKSIYPDLRIPEDIYKRNDYALWLLLSQKCDCYLLDETLAYYRKRESSVSSKKKSHLFKYHVVLYQKLFNYKTLTAFYYSIINVFYYFIRKLKYTKRYTITKK